MSDTTYREIIELITDCLMGSDRDEFDIEAAADDLLDHYPLSGWHREIGGMDLIHNDCDHDDFWRIIERHAR